MKKIKKVLLSREVSDGRLDSILALFSGLKTAKENKRLLYLDWTKVQKISPAGYAILACLVDTAIEQQGKIKNVRIKQEFKGHSVIKNLAGVSKFKALFPANLQNFESPTTLLEGHGSGISPLFSEKLEYKFKKVLSEELIFSCRLILNELMVNSVDHSTAERYYIYAGVFGREFHLGILDMGITIPAKLERKYTGEDDVELLEMSLKEGITTRRQRVGGLGLHHTFENLKKVEGRLTIVSRNAQVRRYFKRRAIFRGKLKYTLDGTWCFARFPL